MQPSDSRTPDTTSRQYKTYVPPELQARFRKLGVFAPDTLLTAEAAAAVWDDLVPENAGDQLQALAKANLLEPHAVDEFRLPAALQSSARMLLEAYEDEWRAARRKHRAYFAAVARRANTPERIRQLTAQLPNLTLAYETAVADVDAELAAEIVWFAEDVLAALGRNEQREQWFRTALELIAKHDGDLRLRQAQLRGTLANTLIQQGSLQEAEVLVRDAWEGFKALGDTHSAAISQTRLAELALKRGALTEAEPLLRDALVTFEQLGDIGGAGYVRDVLSSLKRQPEPQTVKGAAQPDTPTEASHLSDAEIDRLMADIGQQFGATGGQPVRIDAAHLFSSEAPDTPSLTGDVAKDEIASQVLATLEETRNKGSLPGEVFELRIPLIVSAYHDGGEDAVRAHVRSLGMPEEVVEQVIRDLPMLLAEAETLDEAGARDSA